MNAPPPMPATPLPPRVPGGTPSPDDGPGRAQDAVLSAHGLPAAGGMAPDDEAYGWIGYESAHPGAGVPGASDGAAAFAAD